MSDAGAQAIEQAVIDGLLAQEQADWLSSRPTMQMGDPVGGRMSTQMGGRSARGTMLQDCPYYQTTFLTHSKTKRFAD